MPIDSNDVQHLRALFPRIKARFDQRRTHRSGLICKQGLYQSSSVLKLQKATWTNDPMDQLQNQTGLFFSIWTNEEAARVRQAFYNIHALKLRQLAGYRITSRDFAHDFRQSFAPMRAAWPNVSVDYGPQTLMQGWIEVDPDHLEDRFENDALALLERFAEMSPVIDRLLQARRA